MEQPGGGLLPVLWIGPRGGGGPLPMFGRGGCRTELSGGGGLLDRGGWARDPGGGGGIRAGGLVVEPRGGGGRLLLFCCCGEEPLLTLPEAVSGGGGRDVVLTRWAGPEGMSAAGMGRLLCFGGGGLLNTMGIDGVGAGDVTFAGGGGLLEGLKVVPLVGVAPGLGGGGGFDRLALTSANSRANLAPHFIASNFSSCSRFFSCSTAFCFSSVVVTFLVRSCFASAYFFIASKCFFFYHFHLLIHFIDQIM